MRIEYTSLALSGDGWEKKIRNAQEACSEHGFEFGVQIHNSDGEENLDKLYKTGISLSFHAPTLSDWQINLAAEDASHSLQALEHTAGLMRKYAVKQAVFHGFNMTDNPIPSFGRGRGYQDSFEKIKRPDLCISPSSSICSNFFDSPEYIMRSRRVAERLASIRESYPGLQFLIENDFPCYGAGSIFAEHLLPMGNPICLDTSHLWASSHIFDRDFRLEYEAFIESGMVKMVHLHASKFTSAVPKENWSDGHLPLHTENSMNLKNIARLCSKYEVPVIVLEIADVSRKDIDFIADALHE